MAKELDITGQKFGRLTAISRDRSVTNRINWFFSCECGVVKSAGKGSVTKGYQVSCGCYQKEYGRQRKTIHGMSTHPLYKTWSGILHRCNKEDSRNYPDYGGRGIGVCDRWLDINNFISDMGDRPKGATIDRIDNNKGYSPDNCRWTTPLVQGNNKRNNKLVCINGISYSSIAEAARELGMADSTLRHRHDGVTNKDMSAPVRKRDVRHNVGDGRMLTVSEIAKEIKMSEGAVRYRIKYGYTGSELLSLNMNYNYQ